MNQLSPIALFIVALLVSPLSAQTNIALNKTVTASSVQSGNGLSNAVDDNTATRWCASSGTAPQWLMVDLGGSYSISRTEVMWEKTAVYKFGIETSPDNSTWTRRVDRTANTLSQQTFIDNFTASARYVRITATGLPSGAWASIFEFRVFGTSATAAPTITTQPASLTVVEGQSATFTIAATGNPSPGFQWRRNGTTISGANLTSYTITAAAMADSGAVFSCVASNSAGSVTSNNAVLTVQKNSRRQDSLALVALYNSTGGPNWTNKANWLTAQPIDTWYGVTVTSGRVTQLAFVNNGLTGSIPGDLGSLSSLISFDVSQNNLSDTLPASLGNLSNLTSLICDQNQLTGRIPSTFGNLSHLDILYLYQNQLTGEIPSTLGSLANLRELICSNNNLSGSLPSSIGNMPSLQALGCGVNQLTGPIPPEIGNARDLMVIQLQNNQLTGSVPPHIGKLTQLNQLLLSGNLLSNLPDSITYLTNVSTCQLGSNQFCNLSPVAAAWANLHDPTWASSQTCTPLERRQDSLVLVALYNSTGGPNWTNKANWLTSQPINTWYGITVAGDRVEQISLWGTGLAGVLPREIGNLTALKTLDISNCPLLVNPIPNEIGNLKSLTNLTFYNNGFNDSIPSAIRYLSNLTTLHFSEGIPGSIPTWIFAMTKLGNLDLNSNAFTGSIPTEIGNLTALTELRLGYNQLSGMVPSSIGNLKRLNYLGIGINNLTGLPDSLTTLPNVTECYCAYNRFCNLSPALINWLNARDGFWYANQTCSKPEIQITATPSNGAAPLTVSFTATNSGSSSIEQWSWNFGDGGTATSQNTSHTYNTTGTFSARLIGTGIGGADTATVSVLVVSLPAIVTQPASQTVNQGGAVTFGVTASGTAPLSYQWYKNGTIISGATASTYAKSNVQQVDTGSYTVTVSNAAGSVTSNPARLTVILFPMITSQPVSQNVYEGTPATFSVVASGTAPLSYIWRKNGTNISGATTSSYSIAAVQPTDSGNYTVVVSNTAGNATSNVAHLTVLPTPLPPRIISALEPQTISEGGSALFSITVTGTQPFSYEWRKNGIAIGGNTPVFAISPVSFNDSGSYYVIVSNGIGHDTSAIAKLTVVPVTTSPTSKQICIRGMLYNGSGEPVGNSIADSIELTLRLFDSLNGGALEYTEFFRKADRHQIAVERGAFIIYLGQGTTTDTLQSVLALNPNLWVEITVDGPQPDVLLPRLPITASPYSLSGAQVSAKSGATLVQEGNSR